MAKACRVMTCKNKQPCPDHPVERGIDRGSSHNRGYGREWRKLARRRKRDYPICEECGIYMSEVVHHIVPIKDAPERKLDPTNIQALCRDCHERKHGRLKYVSSFGYY